MQEKLEKYFIDFKFQGKVKMIDKCDLKPTLRPASAVFGLSKGQF